MKKIISFLFLLSFLAACAAPESVSAPEPAAAIAQNAEQPTATIEFTPIPTFTAEPTIQPTQDFPTYTPPTTAPSAGSVIQFKANGTYADITDSIPTGTSKTYSVNAMQKQIMSVSILPQIPDGGWADVSMQIVSADGVQICPQTPDDPCNFWRNSLPASDDYLITLTPQSDSASVQFTMRVAINPPGEKTQFFQYNNPATGLSLTYTDQFAPAQTAVANYKTDPELSLMLINTEDYYRRNLGQAYLFVSSTADAQTVATCTEANQNAGAPEYLIGDEVVNGLTFTHFTSEGAGAGNYYQQEIYRTVQNSTCYEVIYFMHSMNIGNFPPDFATEFDREGILQRMAAIFSTFKIK